MGRNYPNETLRLGEKKKKRSEEIKERRKITQTTGA